VGKTKVTCLVAKKRDSLVINTVTQQEANLKEPRQQQSKLVVSNHLSSKKGFPLADHF
jgi:hypothetical protein